MSEHVLCSRLMMNLGLGKATILLHKTISLRNELSFEYLSLKHLGFQIGY